MNGIQVEEANYHEQLVQEYKGNPVIEALPPIKDQNAVIDQICVYPPYNNEERRLDSITKTHLLQRLLRYFQPLPIHLEIQSSLDRMLKMGYIGRNPISKTYAQGFVNKFPDQHDEPFDSTFQTSKSMSIIGVSGVGKTRTLERILSQYPQIISHTSYNDKPLTMYQLSYIIIQTPFDGSVKSIIFDFMYQVDQLLGTQYFNRYANSRLSTSQLMPIMRNIASSLNLGMLIIDEIQHLKSVKMKKSTEVLNFFTTLINTMNIPIVMIGTPKARDVLQSRFRQARRSTNAGNVFWDRMKKDEEWELFINGLWKYQWTTNEVNLDSTFSDRLYEESQGIADIAVKLYMMVQMRAITSGEETITHGLFDLVIQNEMKMVQPVIQALKQNDYRQLVEYEDVMMDDWEEMIERSQKVIQDRERLTSLQEAVESKKESEQALEEVLLRLSMLGIDESVAKKTAMEILEQKPNKEVTALVQMVYNQLKNKDVSSNNKVENDLRDIINNSNESNYQTLLNVGVIKQDYRESGAI